MIGSNIPQIGGLSAGFPAASSWGCECVQVYLTASRTWKVPDLLPETVATFHQARKAAGVHSVVAHVPFLVNLASGDDALFERSFRRLATEVRRAATLGVGGVVLHPGSSGGQTRAEGLRRIASGLRNTLAKLQDSDIGETMILLETMAGQGTTLGSRFEEIACLLDDVNSPAVGVCLDTAHLFAAGYDIRQRTGWHKTMTEFDQVVGIQRIKAIHLNDSREALGSKRDRHANIGKGYLGLETFHAIVTDDRFGRTPKVLETPERDSEAVNDLEQLRTLLAQPASTQFPRPPLGSDETRQGSFLELEHVSTSD